MNARQKHMGIKDVKLIPDGKFKLYTIYGYVIGKNHLGFGMSLGDIWKLSMTELLRNGGKNTGINNEGLDDDPYFESTPKNVIDYLRNN